jgi:hypothetical protein
VLAPWRRLQAEPFEGTSVRSRTEFVDLMQKLEGELEHRHRVEDALAAREENFFVPGRCGVCARQTRFWVDRSYGFPAPAARWPRPNWRERMVCEHCQLNNRMRAAIHYLLASEQPQRNDAVYLTEKVTPLFHALSTLMPGTVGSEFLGDRVPYGECDARGVRNETLARLTFPDAAFHHLLTFDVLEHVPETRPALAECRRVLCPGGLFLFTVPFDANSDRSLRRASLRADGSIEHHTAPEYHGDPLNEAGILSFHTFGWDLLAAVEEHGFNDAHAFVYWSEPLGYLGSAQLLFAARG